MDHAKTKIEQLTERTVSLSKLNPPLTPTPAKPDPPVCPECRCEGVGYYRRDIEIDDPQFGQLALCENAFHQADRVARLSEISGLPPHFLTRVLADITPNEGNKAMLEAAQTMIDDPYGFLYVWGGPGNAKTEVLIALVNHFNRTNRGLAVYTKFTKIIEYIREAFQEKKKRETDPFTDEGYIDRYKRLLSVKVLAIDEMDKVRRETDLVQEFRSDFLDDRHVQAIAGETITLFAGNENPQTFPAEIWDRIRDGRFKVIENTAGSSRPDMKR